MIDLVLECVRVVVLLGLLAYFWRATRGGHDLARAGRICILAGFGLVMFGSLLDITDEFAALSRFVVVGNTGVEEVLENFVGYVGGLVLITYGLVRWIPAVQGLAAEESLRERAMRALNDSEERFRGVMDISQSGIAIHCGGKVVYANPAFARMMGAETAAELIGLDAMDMLHVESRDTIREHRVTMMRTGEPMEFQETRYLRLDGRDFWAESGAVVIPWEEDKRAFMIVARDITTRRTAEMALRDREQRLRRITDAVPGAIVYVDREHRVRFGNRGYADLVGMPQDEIVGKHLSEVRGEAHYRSIIRYIEEALSGKEVTYDVERPSADGRTSYVKLYYVPHFGDDGAVVGYYALILDVTQEREVENALRRSEEKFAKAFRVSPDSLVITRIADGVVVDANDRYVQAVGLPRERIVGRPISETSAWVNPEDRVRYLETLADNGECEDFATDFRMHGGDVVHALLSARSIDIDGQPCVLNITRNITDRVKTLAALRESETRYRGIVEDQTELIARSTPDHALTFVNDAYCRYFGETRDALLGTSFVDHVAAEDKELVLERLASLDAENPVVRFEHRVRQPDGSVRWNDWSDRAILDDLGRVVEVQAVGRDITAKKQAEIDQRASEEKFSKAFDASPDGILIVRRKDWVVVDANEKLLRVRGRRREDVIGRPVQEITEWVEPEAQRRYREILKNGGQCDDFAADFRVLDGRIVNTLLSARPIVVDGERCILSITRNVTQRKQAEEHLRQAQKIEAVGQLTGGVAHDFNNLLAVIMGNLEILDKRVVSDEDQKKLIRTAIAAARRGGTLTRQLLSFARQQPLQPEVVDLDELIEDTHDLLLRTLGEKCSIEPARTPELWNTLADPAQVQTALLNLVINASQAMPGGGVITIATANADLRNGDVPLDDLVPGRYVTIAVRDTGCGMEREVVERAFDPFFTTKEVGRGSGLGLSMVFGFVKQSGGGAKIDSTPGEGTTVTLYLPVIDAPLDAKPPPAPERAEPGGRETVLVVEDNADVRDIAVAMLSNLGYRVLEAVDGVHAIQVAQAEPGIDALFTDMVLPRGMNGMDLAAELRRRRVDLKVLFTSGNFDFDGDLGSRSVDNSAFLQKPYLSGDLAATLRAVLDGNGETAHVSGAH